MKTTKRILTLVLALILSLSVLAGCQQPPAETTAPAQNQTTTPADTTKATPLTNADIYPLDSDKTFTVAVVTTKDVNTYGASIDWERITGVEIDYVNWTAEQLMVAMSTGEIPDAIYYSSGLDKNTLSEYGDAGMFVNWLDYLEYMPNLTKALESYPDILNFCMSASGKVYSLPRVGTTASTHGVIYIRTDMMNAAGWDELPATTEEYLQCLEDIQNYYGANDPEFKAFSAHKASYLDWNSIANITSVLFPSFGDLMRTDLTPNENGEIVLGAATDQYKHYLAYMHKLFSLCDGQAWAYGKDIYTEDGTNAQALAAANKVASGAHLTFLTPDNFASGEYEYTVLAPLTSEYQSEKRFAAKSDYVWMANCINADLPEEDIITMARWFDSFYSQQDDPLNDEGTFWGICYWLGEHTVNWSLDLEAQTWISIDGFKPGNYTPVGGCLGLFEFLSVDVTNGAAPKAVGTIQNTFPNKVEWFDTNLLTLNEEEMEAYLDNWTDINAHISEMTAKFIIGDVDVEEGWAKYISDLEAMGLQEVIDAYQSAYDRYIDTH